MSKVGESVEGISCIHQWEVVEGSAYKCKNCPAKCTRSKGKLMTYSAIPKV